MKKTNNPNSEIKELTKNTTWETLLHPDSYMLFPERDSHMKRIAYTFLKFAEKKDSISVVQFCKKYKIQRQTLYKWAEKNEMLGRCFKEGKLYLGDRLWQGALRKEFEKEMACRPLRKLDPEWQEILSEEAAEKAKNTSTISGIRTVEVPVYIHDPEKTTGTKKADKKETDDNVEMP